MVVDLRRCGGGGGGGEEVLWKAALRRPTSRRCDPRRRRSPRATAHTPQASACDRTRACSAKVMGGRDAVLWRQFAITGGSRCPRRREFS